MRNPLKFLIALALLWTAGLNIGRAQPAPPVNVTVSQATLASGGTVYHYKVINNDIKPIVKLMVGRDYYHGVSELTDPPEGWTFGVASSANISSPQGWRAAVISEEESPYMEVQWRNPEVGMIEPGQTLAGFSVVTPAPNPTYSNAHWTVVFADSTVASGNLIADGSPRVIVKILSAAQQSSGLWLVTLEMANTGGGAATNVSVTNLLLRTLGGTGQVSLMAPTMPYTVGTLAAGSKATVPLTLAVPTSARKLSISEVVSFVYNATKLSLSSSQVLYPKNP